MPMRACTASLFLCVPAGMAVVPSAWTLEAPRALAALTRDQLAASVTRRDRGRLRSVLTQLIAGEPLEYAVVGGSISAGSTLGIHRREGMFLWHGRFLQWLNATFPNARHVRKKRHPELVISWCCHCGCSLARTE